MRLSTTILIIIHLAFGQILFCLAGLQKKYQLEKNQLDIQSAEYANKKLQDDVTLNITTGYIRVLQANKKRAWLYR